jgi:hypothetical protein
MNQRHVLKLIPSILAGATAVLYVGSKAFPATPDAESGSVLRAAAVFVTPPTGSVSSAVMGSSVSSAVARVVAPSRSSAVAEKTASAVEVLASSVRQLSHPRALEDAFASYFAYKAANPDKVRKPYLYFVDYGLSNTTPRGYVFDMENLRVVDGPFMVAHGRGSAQNSRGVPTRFSNSFGAATTSLGLYVAQEIYSFSGHAGGQLYHSVGLRLAGVSGAFNSNARARGVVAHGAPYVTSTRAGRSEGCPAMDPERAENLLPKLANGGLVFLFAPDDNWMTRDPWLSAQVD